MKIIPNIYTIFNIKIHDKVDFSDIIIQKNILMRQKIQGGIQHIYIYDLNEIEHWKERDYIRTIKVRRDRSRVTIVRKWLQLYKAAHKDIYMDAEINEYIV